ncbi:unnamed protein product [Miscanthus lutarioriparius]|uniref:Uncharacterized protein n=1 Tax=Miscanthus lutarioriparius TaxID=422564 RepID=A0A811R756_9POAL|nr:unnamed protein product [Miscanthus lutarioriparius]
MLSSRLGNNVDNRLKFPLTHSLLLLLCYAAAVVPGSAAPEYRRSRAPATYYPQPNDFPNEQLYHAYVVIQRFKNTITCDPRQTSSWIGHNICESGSLPANLGFSKLSYLALANNNFSGTIPPSIQHLQGSLLEILLLNNQLSGCLPHELGMLTNAAVIDAGMNQLTCPIPSSFSCVSSVEQLNLAGNRLYGEVPDALFMFAAGPAGRLANLSLFGNYFTSIGPVCAAMIKDGVLDVNKNCIPGLDNQRRPVECAAFLSQPKTMCRASSTQVTCPAAASQNAAARGNRKARDYYS